MTTTEIQALVTQRRAVKIPPTADGCYNYDDPLCAAIETLLARDNIRTFAEQEVRIAELDAELRICRESERILEGEKNEAFRQLTTEQYTIQSLTAELARVKAESLRVVEVDAQEISPLEAIFRHGDCVVQDASGKFYQLSRGATQFPDGLDYHTGVFIVRLERWEDEG
jgi:hypothetical protein